MVPNYSKEARRVIFCARVEAGSLGGPYIEVDHLLAGIVLQDQNDVSSVMSRMGTNVPPTMGLGQFFLAPEVAAALLAKVEEQKQSSALPLEQDMPLTEDCKNVLQEAQRLAGELEHAEIKPLHLLVASLGIESSRGVLLLREHGITRELALARLRSGG